MIPNSTRQLLHKLDKVVGQHKSTSGSGHGTGSELTQGGQNHRTGSELTESGQLSDRVRT